ncbi:hypothetical protein BH11BAC7_BH11BAC7_18640 [soil metagenome]
MCRSPLFSIIFLTTITISVSAQQDSSSVHSAKNAFFIEFGGNAEQRHIEPLMKFSINYDRIFFENEIIRISVRLGYTIPKRNYYYHIPYDRSEHIIPVMVNLLIGKQDLFLELGFGEAFVFFNSDHKHVYTAPTSVIGARLQSKDGGLVARIGLTLTTGKHSTNSYPYLGCLAGISLGYSF